MMFTGLLNWWKNRSVPQKTLLILIGIFAFVLGMFLAGYYAGKLIGPSLN
ncbi:hypothetical protein [Shewanella waksmanii]